MSKVKMLFDGTNVPVYAKIEDIDENFNLNNEEDNSMRKVKILFEGTNVPVYAKIEDVNEDVFTGLCFTAKQGNSTVKLKKYHNAAWTGKYSLDNVVWRDYVFDTVITLANSGDKVYFKGDITADFNANDSLEFNMTGKIAASGNVNSMYVSEGFDDLTTLTYKYCYSGLFDSCTALVTAPELPSIALSEGCYAGMFAGTGLVIAPELPATTLTKNCYMDMFKECESLVTASALPALVLAEACYGEMYEGCISLENIPALPAPTLATNCYQSMFEGCTKIKMAAAQSADYPNKFEFGAAPTGKADDMFKTTGGTFTGDPTTTVYYTANTIAA